MKYYYLVLILTILALLILSLSLSSEGMDEITRHDGAPGDFNEIY